MKIAISGKGGVGKSTLSAALSLLMAKSGKRVLAVDADPDANLAAALGFTYEEQKEIIPISRQVALIEERTGAKVDQFGQMFKMNPEVSDVADAYASVRDGVSLLVLGAVKRGGGGCACPENVMIRALVTDLILNKDDVVIMDMEAGIEHLGRATTSGVDVLIIVVEPGHRSVDGAKIVEELARQINLNKILYVANKVDGPEDEQFIRENLPERRILEFIPYSRALRQADRPGLSVLDGLDSELLARFESVLDQIEDSA